MDIGNLMKMASQVKEQMENAQQDAAKILVTGEAGGGMVKVVMNGNHEMVQLTIEPSIVNSDEAGLLEDLIRAASNQAVGKVKDALKEHMGSMVSDMGIDLSTLGFPK
jgi:hypothetical protein